MDAVAPAHARGVWHNKVTGQWVSELVVAGGGRRRQCYQSREAAESARRASEAHPVAREALQAHLPRARRPRRPRRAAGSDGSTVDEPDREPGLYAFASGVLLMTPPPVAPMPEGVRYDIHRGRRVPAELAVEPVPSWSGATPPPARRLDVAEIERYAREIGPRVLSKEARAVRRSRRPSHLAAWGKFPSK